MEGPVRVTVEQGRALIWDAQGAHRMRDKHRLIGVLLGGPKHNSSVGGLPLMLSPWETTMALQEGWIVEEVEGARLERQPESGLPDPPHQEVGLEPPPWKLALERGLPYAIPVAKSATPISQLAGDKPPERLQLPLIDEAAARMSHPLEEAGDQTRPRSVDAGLASHTAGQNPAQEPPRKGEEADAGLTSHSAGQKHAREPMRRSEEAGEEAAGPSEGRTGRDESGVAVFRDLHAKGFQLTPGVNFGADLLAYPGSPAQYHAHFCVRVVGWGEPLRAVQLACAARGAHSARKHLLLASLPPAEACGGGCPRAVQYLTIAPEAGFGTQDVF